jgi:hypothetical protein
MEGHAMEKVWQDVATGEWFRRIAATEDVVAATGKSWVDVPLSKPDPTLNTAESSSVAEIAADGAELGLDVLTSGIDLDLGDIASAALSVFDP